MKIVNRNKRNRDVYCYKLGLEGELPHTMFEVRLKYDLSHNQVHLIINGNAKYKGFGTKVVEYAAENGIPAAATKFELSTETVQKIIDGHQNQN